jgi:hypothetical protein
MAKRTLTRWLVIASIALSPGPAISCECAEMPQREAFQHAAVVFRGRVTQINHLRFVPDGDSVRVEIELSPPAVNDHTLVSFDVVTYWKGHIKRAIKVYATARPSMCDGYRFEQGKEYVVYTRPMDPSWAAIEKFVEGAPIYEVADCPLRVIRDDVPREIRLLGRGRSPAKE